MNSKTWADPFRLAPALPEGKHMDDLRDLAHDVLLASENLEAKLAPETAQAIGDKLRILNSLYSNKIEGQVSTFGDIERGLKRDFSLIPKERYAQELGAAHVNVERKLMKLIMEQPEGNISHPDFIRHIHRSFFEELPPEHQYTHEEQGFTNRLVMPGVLRDHRVGVSGPYGATLLGPETRKELEANLKAFGDLYDPASFKGGEARIVAAAAAHLKLAWLHPFSDGNGRTVRLHTTFFMAKCGINRANLWSLSRGLSENRQAYMVDLLQGDPQPTAQDRNKIEFTSKNVAGFCEGFLEICKEQIGFMRDQLKLHTVGENIDRFADLNLGEQFGSHKGEAGRLLRAVYASGKLERAEAYTVFDSLNERTRQTIINGLVKEGLLETKTHRAGLTIGLPAKALAAYFPKMCPKEVMGSFVARDTVQQQQPTLTPKTAKGRGASGFELG